MSTIRRFALRDTYFRILKCVCFLILISCKGNQDHLPFFNTADFAPEWISDNDQGYSKIHRVPSFSFFDQDGNTITNKTIDRKIVVADFFFTICPGICPRLTKSMAVIQDKFPGDKQLVLLSHSVTPELDSVPRLKEYAATHHVNADQWHLLTGDRKEIYAIARHGYFADEETGLKKSESEFLHTENFVLLDGRQRIRGVYNGTNPTEVERLIEDIKTLKLELNADH